LAYYTLPAIHMGRPFSWWDLTCAYAWHALSHANTAHLMPCHTVVPPAAPRHHLTRRVPRLLPVFSAYNYAPASPPRLHFLSPYRRHLDGCGNWIVQFPVLMPGGTRWPDTLGWDSDWVGPAGWDRMGQAPPFYRWLPHLPAFLPASHHVHHSPPGHATSILPPNYISLELWEHNRCCCNALVITLLCPAAGDGHGIRCWRAYALYISRTSLTVLPPPSLPMTVPHPTQLRAPAPHARAHATPHTHRALPASLLGI